MPESASRAVRGDRRAPSRGDRQRTAIITAVTGLLGSVPIRDLSVSRISEQAGVSRPAFYFYFESKYSVVAAALAEVWAEVDAATADLDTADDRESPDVLTGRMLDAAVAVWNRHAALLEACAQARDSDPQLREMWNGFMTVFVRKLARFVDRQRSIGRTNLAADDVPALVAALASMTIGVLRQESVPAAEVPVERALDTVRAIWLRAIWG